MKNFIIILTGALMLLTYGCQNKAVRVKATVAQTILLNETFHGINCNGGVGLCTVTKNNGGNSLGVYAERVDNQKINILVYRNQIPLREELNITGNEISKEPGSAVYYIGKDIIIDTQVAKALNLDKGYVKIAKGNYDMNFNKDFITFHE